MRHSESHPTSVRTARRHLPEAFRLTWLPSADKVVSEVESFLAIGSLLDLCGNSVSLWLSTPDRNHHRDTESSQKNTEVTSNTASDQIASGYPGAASTDRRVSQIACAHCRRESLQS